eukprot:TRINITY_DN1868_c2_g1_i1.p1 TRINITY_DN1868_c2_g1~~TRINITY_DN1868_c2_g1_i1.p1  ORF type:complete len:157 (+),score=39.91 TRINITY_DN1868_c2_g1_i1:121-591(+)
MALFHCCADHRDLHPSPPRPSSDLPPSPPAPHPPPPTTNHNRLLLLLSMASAAATTTVRFVAHGTVQGVFLRVVTKNKATSMRLKGFVRNLIPGDRMEGVVAGTTLEIDLLLNWLMREGSPGSEVHKIEKHVLDVSEVADLSDSFQIVADREEDED